MCHICRFCCLTFQTEPQTPWTGTQIGAASMLSVINLTVIWRGKRQKVQQTYWCLALHYILELIQSAVHWIFTVDPSINSRPQLATRLLAHKIQSPQEWEAMQALLVSLNLSQQMFCHQLLQQWLSPEMCIYGTKAVLYFHLDAVDQGLIFRSQHRYCCSLCRKWKKTVIL